RDMAMLKVKSGGPPEPAGTRASVVQRRACVESHRRSQSWLRHGSGPARLTRAVWALADGRLTSWLLARTRGFFLQRLFRTEPRAIDRPTMASFPWCWP